MPETRRSPGRPRAGRGGRVAVETARRLVDEFVAQEALAVVGVSRDGMGFGNLAMRELAAAGYRVLPVHPAAESAQGRRCARDLASLPEPVGGVLVVVPPAQAERVVRDAAAAGITRVWLQQGSESPAALARCAEHGIDTVHGECILMFLPRTRGIHRLHRGVRRLLGRMPR